MSNTTNRGEFLMTLSVNNQLMLLHDILDEHHVDRSGSVAEYQQIKRLVQAIITKDSIADEQLLQLLPEMYDYGKRGESAQNQPEHITSYQNNIESWLSAIQQTSEE